MLRRILLALAVAAALGVLLYTLVRKEEGEAREARADARLVLFDDRSVTSLVLSTRDGRARFEGRGASWRMTEPLEDAGDAAAIETLLGALRRVPVRRTISDPESLGSYGLDPPVASIEIGAAGPVPRVDLGDPDPTGEGLFARVAGRDGVLVLGLPEAFALQGPSPQRLRDPTLLGALANEIAKIGIRSGDGSLGLSREPDGWWIVEPARLPASDASVAGLLSRLEAVSVRVFGDGIDPADPALGLGPESLRITVETPGVEREIVLGTTAPDGLRAALRDDRKTVLRVEKADEIDPAPRVEAFLDEKLTKANRYRVVEFTDESDGRAVRATRKGEGSWETEDGTPVPEDAVLAYLARLLEAPIAGTAPATTAPAGRVATYRLEDGTEERIEVLPGGLARRASLPETAFRLKGPLPDPPRP